MSNQDETQKALNFWYAKARELESKLKIATEALKIYSEPPAYKEVTMPGHNWCDDFCPRDCNEHTGEPYTVRQRTLGHGTKVAKDALEKIK